jgi:SNF2 family DNA or RNA helicase
MKVREDGGVEFNVLEMQRKYGGMRPKHDSLGRKRGQRLKYRWKKRPYAHQVLGVKRLLELGFGGALLCEPRTGKTKIAIDYASIMHAVGKVNRVLVFGPVSALAVWKDELKENCPYPYRLTTWDKSTRKRTNLELPPIGDDILDFVIVNYDALSTAGGIITHKLRVCARRGCGQIQSAHTPTQIPGHLFRPGEIREFNKHPITGEIKRSRSRGGRFDVKKKLIRWQPQLIILDESHRIKNPTAKKTTALYSISEKANPDYRIICTGTVVTKKKRLFDIYSQWKFMNPGRFGDMTFAEFKAEYGKWVARDGWSQWKGNRNEEKLHRLVHLDSYSITRDECYDLPKSTDQIIHVELDEGQSAEVYDQMAEEMVARIRTGEITEASIALVQALRLRQITSGLSKTTSSPEYPKGRLVVIGSEKLRAIRSRLEDLLEMDEKVVIGALFTADIYRIQKMLKQMKVPTFVIQGGMKNHEREYAWKQFPKVDGGAVFLGQPAAAGEAIDLSCASIMQWYSLTPSWVNFRQFSDRIALSDKPTFHEFFLARGTNDELAYETLVEDGNLGKRMIQSPERLLRLQESGN